jgi:hypothetical protein
MKKLKMVYVEWGDSSSLRDGWSSWSQIKDFTKEITMVISCGFLVHEDKEKIILTHSTDHDIYEVHCPIKIPKCTIKKMRILK